MRLFGYKKNNGDNSLILSHGEYLFWKDRNSASVKELFKYMPDVFAINQFEAHFGANLLHILPLIRICYNLGHEELLLDRPLYEAKVKT